MINEMQNKATGRGGPRPKLREDDGRVNSGGARQGAGPKPKQFALRLGNVHYVHVRTAEGKASGPTMTLKITKVERDHVELTDEITGEIYKIVR